jgi:hypothetical protein
MLATHYLQTLDKGLVVPWKMQCSLAKAFCSIEPECRNEDKNITHVLY